MTQHGAQLKHVVHAHNVTIFQRANAGRDGIQQHTALRARDGDHDRQLGQQALPPQRVETHHRIQAQPLDTQLPDVAVAIVRLEQAQLLQKLRVFHHKELGVGVGRARAEGHGGGGGWVIGEEGGGFECVSARKC